MTFVVKYAPVMSVCKCCCCSCSLRSTNIVLGWIILIVNIVTAVMYTILLLNYDDLVGQSYNVPDVMPKELAKPGIITIISICAVDCVQCIVFLYGVYKRKPMFMLPYIVIQLIGIILMALVLLAASIYFIVVNWIAGLSFLLTSCASILLCGYLWDISYSYYRQLEDEKVHTLNF